MSEAVHYNRVDWTEERDAILLQHTNDGKSAREIAALMGDGFTRYSIVGRWHRLRARGQLPALPEKKKSAGRPPKAKSEPSMPAAPRASAALVLDVGIGDVPHTKRGRPFNPRGLGNPVSRALPEPVPLVNGARITIMQLSSRTCKWPIGDPGTKDFCFCGHTPREKSPYCEFHARAAYVPLQDRRHKVFG